jgi:hypothetical protein
MAEQALLRGLLRMTAFGENVTVADQTLTDLDLFEVGCPSLMFPMTRGARLINPCMILSEKNRGMTGNTPVGHHTRPGSMATAAVALERGMRLGQLLVHEDRLMPGQEHPSREGNDQRCTSHDSIASELSRHDTLRPLVPGIPASPVGPVRLVIENG